MGQRGTVRRINCPCVEFWNTARPLTQNFPSIKLSTGYHTFSIWQSRLVKNPVHRMIDHSIHVLPDSLTGIADYQKDPTAIPVSFPQISVMVSAS